MTTQTPHAATRLQIVASSFLSCAALLSLPGCGGGGTTAAVPAPPPPPPSVASVERNVLPATTDTSVTTALEAHVVINPSTAEGDAHKLFVFLPGTGGTPDLYREILRSGTRRGYHAIGLNYPNSEAIGTLCDGHPDTCYWDARREVITGTDLSTVESVGPGDSIVTRLTDLITYLNTNSPTEGWGQFLSGGSVDWSKVVISGHSQGGGHAGVMTKLYPIARACYFASPADFSTGPVDWESAPSMTPTSAQYGFVSVSDNLVPASDLAQIWPAMGLAGSMTSVDSGSYAGAHQLTTNATPVGGLNPYHGVTVIDAATPMSGGVPVFDPVWAYMCFE